MTSVNLPKGVFSSDNLHEDRKLTCDVVVVGSGGGGSVVGAELAEAGYDVIIVEEGRYFSTSHFSGKTGKMVQDLYRDGGATIAMGRPPVMYQEGRTVGGSTVINGGMYWRTPENILKRWSEVNGLSGLTPKELTPYFERVERRTNVALQDESTAGKDNSLLKETAESKGWNVVTNLRNQLHCPGSNNCAFGCPTGAKQSALVTYIPRALHFGARLYSDLRAEYVQFSGKRATGVVARVVEKNEMGATIRINARQTVVACGAVHTPGLLMRSGFSSPSGMLGRNLSLHPNCKVSARFDEPIRGWEGVHQAYQVREFQKEGLVFAAVNIPPSVMAMTLPMYGSELGDYLNDYSHLLIAGLLCEDSSTGRVRLGPKRKPQSFYQLADSDFARLTRGARLLCELLFDAGATSIQTPFAGLSALKGYDDLKNLNPEHLDVDRTELLTVHLMGTAQMGAKRSSSVTDEFGRVHGAADLMIADASLFPSPIGVNPVETIQALATRNAHFLIHSLSN